MINIKDMTPNVYMANSRDFQVLARTLEVLLNYVQMNIDNMEGNYRIDNMNQGLINLFLLSLGFEGAHNYTNVDLEKVAKVFKWLMKRKGTKEAIYDIVYLLLRSQHLEEEFSITIHTIKNNNVRTTTSMTPSELSDLYTIDLYLPRNLKDLVLLEDLFDYILPAGFTYTLREYEAGTTSTTKVKVSGLSAINTSAVNGSPLINQVFDSSGTPSGETPKSLVFGGK